MNIRELQYLVAVAETQHFGKAAQRCFVSQPTLSTQLKKLEDELGVVLFERTNKSVMVTPIGETLIAQAREVLEKIQKIKQIAANANDPFAGPFRLGIIPTLGPYLLPYILPAVKKTFPKLELIVNETQTSVVLEQLRQGHLDAIILALPVHTDGLVEEKLFQEPFYVMLPASHPLIKKEKISMKDLESETLLLLEEGHCLREQALEACQLRQVQQNEFSATSLETLRHIVSLGSGITLLPALAVKSAMHEKNIVIKPILQNTPTREVGILWRQTSVRSDCCKALAEQIKRQVKTCDELNLKSKFNVLESFLDYN